MPVGLGRRRFLVEAGFLIVVAVIAGVARLSAITIVLLMAVAGLLVAAVECARSHVRRAHAVQAALPAGVARRAAPPPEVSTEPQPQPQPGPGVAPAPIRGQAAEPEPSAADEPVPIQPRIVVAPPAAARDAIALVPRGDVVQQPPEVVSLAARATSPREWNLWDLERLARNTAGTDVARDEERGYILMYLRDFANADGALPADFDSVVRESFGDVLDAVHS